MPRLERLWNDSDASLVYEDAERRRDRLQLIIEEAAADGAVLVEIRVGNEALLCPDIMETFRAAERRAQARFPVVHAELVGVIKTWAPALELDHVVRECVRLRREGLAGVDFMYRPYADEAEWQGIYAMAGELASCGLGITVHAGEFSSANIIAALSTPGISRIGHALHASTEDVREALVSSSVAVECCLTSNVLLGAVLTYEEHPIRSFWRDGIPVVLGTDNPLVMATSIGKEYLAAAELGFTIDELCGITTTAIHRSFASEDRKALLLRVLAGKSGTPRAPAR